MRTLRLALVPALALVGIVLGVAACGTSPTEPAVREQPFVGGDPPPPPPPRTTCDSTGGSTCHGTLPWY